MNGALFSIYMQPGSIHIPPLFFIVLTIVCFSLIAMQIRDERRRNGKGFRQISRKRQIAKPQKIKIRIDFFMAPKINWSE